MSDVPVPIQPRTMNDFWQIFAHQSDACSLKLGRLGLARTSKSRDLECVNIQDKAVDGASERLHFREAAINVYTGSTLLFDDLDPRSFHFQSWKWLRLPLTTFPPR